ncbi:MAG: serpin family protein [Flavonifractor plautii]
MKKRKLLALCLVPALLAGCAAPAGVTDLSRQFEAGAPAPPEADPAADAAIGTLGAELLRAAREPGENTLLSPLSVALALSMTANGAAEDTLAEFEALLGADVAALNANAASLLADYAALGELHGVLHRRQPVAGRAAGGQRIISLPVYGVLWGPALSGRSGYRRGPPGGEQLGGEVTRGLIPEVLAETPAPETVLLLVNALYLKNAWASEFDPLDTRPGDFTAADGSEAETDFLSNGLRAEQYFAAEGAAGVVLPYDDGRLGFLAVLPDGELDAWLETLDGDTLPALLAAAEEERVLLRLPKFEAEWGGELKELLAELGLETAFDPAQADFSALGTAPDGPLYVSSVVHKARIEVNEKGTEAAAATVAGLNGAAAPTDYRELVLDRPFCYAVVDLERGVPLFLGTFERP